MASDFDHPDYDENPEWTEEDFAKARPASEVHGEAAAAWLVRKPGRPPMAVEQRKARVSIRLSPDVLDHYRAGGRGWQTRLEEALRRAMTAK